MAADYEADSDASSNKAPPSFDDVENTASLPKLQSRLLTCYLWNKRVPPVPLQSERKHLPINTSSFISKAFLFYITPLLSVGYRRTVTQQDLWTLGDDLSIDSTYVSFQKNLQDIIDEHHKKSPDAKADGWPKNAMFWAFWRTFKYEMSMTAILGSAAGIFTTLTPLLTKYLIEAVEENDTRKGVGYAIGVAVILYITSFLTAHSLLNGGIAAIHMTAILTKAVLDKSLTANSETRHRYPSGSILTFVGADMERIQDAGYGGVGIFGTPFSFVIGIAILCVNLHASALAGIAVFILLMAGTGIPAKMYGTVRLTTNTHTDRRTAMIRQIVQSMQMVKFYSWEEAYEKIVSKLRQKEISYVYKLQFLFAALVANSLGAAGIISMTAFLVSYAVSGLQGSAVLFSSLTLFSIITQSLTQLSSAGPVLIDGLRSLERIAKYLQCPDETGEISEFYDNSMPLDKDEALRITDASFYWNEFSEKSDESEKNSAEKTKKEIKAEKKIAKKKAMSLEKDITVTQKVVLHNVNISIKKGSFVVVTGLTGSGKSSLLSAMSALIGKSEGTVNRQGDILLCGAPTVLNDTIKTNILFGEQYQSEKYKQVLDVCALESDLSMFKARDMTEVGERGVTLSGGQKARVNLARAVYHDRDIYLFDDVISAVDANVGKHIVEKCMLEYLEGKTRVLATHNLAVIHRADQVIFVNSDGSVSSGSEAELLDVNPEFKQLMAHQHEVVEKPNDWAKDNIDVDGPIDAVARQKSHAGEEDGALVMTEERAVNSIPVSMYFDYLAVGWGPTGRCIVLPMLLLICILVTFSSIFTNVWLSYWLEDKFTNFTAGKYIGVYITLNFLTWILTWFEFGILGYAFAYSAKVLHLEAIHRVLHTPMSFMDSTPIGRIMNRFTKDTNSLDNSLPMQLKLFIHLTVSCVGVLILAVIYVPWFAISLPFLVGAFVGLCNYFQATGREVKRLEAIQRSFVMNNVNEVLNGYNTIRAYGSQQMFGDKNDKLVDEMNEVSFVNIVNRRWVNLGLNLIAATAVLIITLLSATRVFGLSPAATGLLTNYMIQFASLSSIILNTYTMAENEMNSVERTFFYARDLVQEASYRKNETRPAPEWPQHGAIKFDNASLRYRPGLPLVLKNLSIEVGAAEKIGICGRTGAGKSSLMNILFRITELETGSIFIDGIDISTLGLNELRSKLSIIPQDPVLFQGTIKSNLDPFGEKSDDELWEALRRGGLIKSLDSVKTGDVKDHKFHLDAVVEDEGNNFSLGERQLIALTRALVRQSKILVMDEATSNVDYETDSLIQETIAREFKDCTILCIAHRLKTILKYDRVLVLEKGELDEFDKPHRLFAKGGRFREMCSSAGITEADFH